MRHLVAVGKCCVETISSVPQFVSEGDKVHASDVKKRRGGNSSNVLEVLGQLFQTDLAIYGNIGLHLVAVLPSSRCPVVQDIDQSLGPGVDTEFCIYREECTEPAASYIVRNLESNSRTVISHNPLPEMEFREFKRVAETLRSDGFWYHFEGRAPDVTLRCMRYLREKFPAAKITVEIENFPSVGLQELVAEADAAFYSKTWALGNGYNDAETCLRAQALICRGVRLFLCCTWGDQGASALDIATGEYFHEPAWTPFGSSVIDTAGASDAFIAGMVYSCIAQPKHWSLQKRLEFANRLAGYKVAQEGFSRLGYLIRRVY